MNNVDIKQKIRFEELYESFSQTVFRYIYFRTRDKEVATDLMQTVFVKFFENINKVRESEERFYVITIAKNIVIDFYRTKKQQVEYDEDVHGIPSILLTDENPVVEEAIVKESAYFIEKVLSKMPESEAEIIRLRALLEWSYSEIAMYLKKQEQSVRKQYSRAIEKLKILIQKTYESR